MLKVDLRRLKEAPIRLQAELADDDPVFEGVDVGFAETLSVRLKVEIASGRRVWVRGTIEATLREPCRRCLTDVDSGFERRLELLFDPTASTEDEDMSLYALDPSADELDLAGPVREQFLLARPRFMLCREECAGLCEQCGADLNDGECGCTRDDADPRWAPLRALQAGT